MLVRLKAMFGLSFLPLSFPLIFKSYSLFLSIFFPLPFILLFPFLLKCLLRHAFFPSYNSLRHWQKKYYKKRDATEYSEDKTGMENGRRKKPDGKESGVVKGWRAAGRRKMAIKEEILL
jgi:hypothetical protein